MKIQRIYILMILGLLLFSISCNDFLEENPISSIDTDYIYSTPEGLEVGVNALYNLQRKNIFPTERNGIISAVNLIVGTDLGLTRTFFHVYEAEHNPSDYPADKWTLPYQIIDRANAIITNASNIEMDEAKKNELVAQARLLRGELYFELIRIYDNILLDTIATTPENASDPVEYKPANPSDVFKLIDADLDFAIEHLDYDVEYGRYGQGAARHIKGKSAMWQGKWSEASNQFNNIVENGTHFLLPDIKKVFAQDLDHAEMLFVFIRDKELGGNDNLAGGAGNTWCSLFKDREYELSSGEVIKDQARSGQSLGWAFPNDYLRSLYDEVNDKRFETYYWPLTKYVNNPDKSNFGEPLPESSYDDNFRRHHWSLKKYFDPEKSVGTNGGYKDNPMYRFAETLLLGAEANWRADNENPTNAKALEYINKIRERSFGNSDQNFTEFTFESYLEESARELAFEGNRWFLLKRLGLLVERQNLYCQKGSNSGNVVTIPMSPYMVRCPIPQSQIDLMGTFPQNQGY